MAMLRRLCAESSIEKYMGEFSVQPTVAATQSSEPVAKGGGKKRKGGSGDDGGAQHSYSSPKRRKKGKPTESDPPCAAAPSDARTAFGRERITMPPRPAPRYSPSYATSSRPAQMPSHIPTAGSSRQAHSSSTYAYPPTGRSYLDQPSTPPAAAFERPIRVPQLMMTNNRLPPQQMLPSQIAGPSNAQFAAGLRHPGSPAPPVPAPSHQAAYGQAASPSQTPLHNNVAGLAATVPPELKPAFLAAVNAARAGHANALAILAMLSRPDMRTEALRQLKFAMQNAEARASRSSSSGPAIHQTAAVDQTSTPFSQPDSSLSRMAGNAAHVHGPKLRRAAAPTAVNGSVYPRPHALPLMAMGESPFPDITSQRTRSEAGTSRKRAAPTQVAHAPLDVISASPPMRDAASPSPFAHSIAPPSVSSISKSRECSNSRAPTPRVEAHSSPLALMQEFATYSSPLSGNPIGTSTLPTSGVLQSGVGPETRGLARRADQQMSLGGASAASPNQALSVILEEAGQYAPTVNSSPAHVAHRDEERGPSSSQTAPSTFAPTSGGTIQHSATVVQVSSESRSGPVVDLNPVPNLSSSTPLPRLTPTPQNPRSVETAESPVVWSEEDCDLVIQTLRNSTSLEHALKILEADVDMPEPQTTSVEHTAAARIEADFAGEAINMGALLAVDPPEELYGSSNKRRIDDVDDAEEPVSKRIDSGVFIDLDLATHGDVVGERSLHPSTPPNCSVAPDAQASASESDSSKRLFSSAIGHSGTRSLKNAPARRGGHVRAQSRIVSPTDAPQHRRSVLPMSDNARSTQENPGCHLALPWKGSAPHRQVSTRA